MIWNVATCVVTPGTSVASRNRTSTRLRPRNRKRSSAYAVPAPMRMVPEMAAPKMSAVLKNASAMPPLVNAST